MKRPATTTKRTASLLAGACLVWLLDPASALALRLFVGVPDGQTLSLEAESDDTIEAVIDQIADELGVQPSCQELTFSGTTLEEGRTLAEHNIPNDSILQLVNTCPVGADCDDYTDCETGFCTHGVCCEVDCGGGTTTDCRACASDLTDEVDGLCRPVYAGAPCGWIQTTECSYPDTCDGQGVCAWNDVADSTECDNGVFCDGPDACSLGSCVPLDVDPCETGTTCNEDLAMCVRTEPTGGSGGAPIGGGSGCGVSHGGSSDLALFGVLFGLALWRQRSKKPRPQPKSTKRSDGQQVSAARFSDDA